MGISYVLWFPVACCVHVCWNKAITDVTLPNCPIDSVSWALPVGNTEELHGISSCEQNLAVTPAKLRKCLTLPGSTMLSLAPVKVAKKLKNGGAFWRAATYEEPLRCVGPNAGGNTYI